MVDSTPPEQPQKPVQKEATQQGQQASGPEAAKPAKEAANLAQQAQQAGESGIHILAKEPSVQDERDGGKKVQDVNKQQEQEKEAVMPAGMVEKLLRGSFDLSQGNLVTQRLIFELLTHYYDNKIDLSPKDYQDVVGGIVQYVRAIATPQEEGGIERHTPVLQPYDVAKGELDVMMSVFNGIVPVGDKKEMLSRFLQEWVERDNEFVGSNGEGRPRSVLTSDMYGSQFFDLILLGKRSVPGFEGIMDDARDMITELATIPLDNKMNPEERDRAIDILFRIDLLRRAYNNHSTQNEEWVRNFQKGNSAVIVHKPVVLPEEWEKRMRELGIIREPRQ